VVFINLVAIVQRNEFVTGDARHRGEYSLVSNPAGTELRLDHGAALSGEHIDLGFCSQLFDASE
jgi:hypothetical protein